jgi:hypothetical protein
MISEDLDLQELTQQLRTALGDADPVGYLRGKSLMRNALVHARGVSELEAEELIDTLEQRGFLKYSGDPSEPSRANAHWKIAAWREDQSNTSQPNRGK